jgi:5,10-methylenetetrahydromethanopterin reductase
VRFSLRLNNDLDPATFVELAEVAEQAGFTQLWVSNDLFLRSAPVLVTAAAARTSRLHLGTGIMNPYSVHPAELAMLAGTLQEVSDGRFLLGLGAGATDFLRWAGLDRPRPLARTRAAVTAIRTLLDGGRPVDRDGTGEGWTADAYLRVAAVPTPIYLGVMSPRMLALAGEVADGALPLLFPPEHFATAADQADVGLVEGGRTRDAFDLAACVWASVDDDREVARHALAAKIAYFGPSFAPYLLERAGLAVEDFAPITTTLRSQGIEAAARLVDDRMLRLGIAGSAAEVTERCRSLVDAGARHVSFGPPLGPDPRRAVEVLGAEVLPALRARADEAPV